MSRYVRGRFISHFLPFMIMVIGGSFFAREFTMLRYKYRNTEILPTDDELAKHGIKKKKLATLEEEYEEIKQMDIDNWENVRIPRPWVEPDNTDNQDYK